jgi:hypothetical protein
LILLLIAALFTSLGANLAFARNDAAHSGAATLANEQAGHRNAEQGSLPAAVAGQHYLAVLIARLVTLYVRDPRKGDGIVSSGQGDRLPPSSTSSV